MELSEDTFNRLSLSIIEKLKCSPEEAIKQLESLRIFLICGERIKTSLPLQAALITAINTGKRAFLGGIYIHMPLNTPCLLQWPGEKTFNKIIAEVGGIVIETIPDSGFKIMFGLSADIDTSSVQVACNDWQAGILAESIASPFEETGSIPTAGIFAGAFAIGLAFLRESGINIAACDASVGISLWRPDLDWLDGNATGPVVTLLPKKFWLLGLGHLGQAYLWNIALLPYKSSEEVTVLLQDYDRIVEANVSAGLLCEKEDTKTYKTRKCASWLEARGFKTIITERKFNEYTKRVDEEPFVALCGFDNAAARISLESAGFDLIVESALGGNLVTFDNVILHTFPDTRKTPKDIWSNANETEQEINYIVHQVLKEKDKETCGIVPLSIAGKSVSASFVGACSGALVIAELLRGLNGGIRYEKIVAHIRALNDRSAIPHKNGNYSIEMSKNGFVDIKL